MPKDANEVVNGHANGPSSSPTRFDLDQVDQESQDTMTPIPQMPTTEKTPLLNIRKKLREKKVNRYYDSQVQLLESYHCDLDHLAGYEQQQQNGGTGNGGDPPVDLEAKQRKRDELLAKIVLVLNLVLLAAKIAAAALSNSLSVISTVIESAVDLVSGIIIWATSSAISKRDPYEYPRGRTKLEPLAVIFVSIVMGVANIQVIIQAITQIVEKKVEPEIDVLTISILGVGILSKVLFFVFCLREAKKSSSASVLAQDARNDVMTNFVALVCAFIGARYWIYADPIGAILVSTWVACNWFYTAAGQVPLISGKSAPPDYINRIIRISIEHDARIRYLETVFVYHYGNKYLVEVHIVLNPEMALKEAHDIFEGLQRKLEALDFVERAFVHPDYEFCHKPSDEHKVV